MRRVAWVFALAIAAACGVDLKDPPEGLLCDTDSGGTRGCIEGRTCVESHCVVVDAGEGGGAGGGGGTGGGGVGGGGGGSEPDAGQILWAQWRDGFTGQDVVAGCLLDIETTFNNKVVSTIASSAQNKAAAVNSAQPTLALNGNGRLRGKFQIPNQLSLKGNSTWFLLGPASAPLIQLRFTSTGALECFSAPNTLSPAAINQSVTWPGGFAANTDYLVDITWKRGEYRSIAINGGTALQAGLTPPDGGFVKPTEMRVGINNYNATADAGWTITLTDWALGEEPETVITGP